MKSYLKRFTGYAAAPFLIGAMVSGCSDDVVRNDTVADGELLDIRAVISQQASTRADESGFADGDRMGVFVVGYSSWVPGDLTADSNHANNVAFTLDAGSGQWNAPTPLYWPDSKSGADIYGYYPFDNRLSEVDAYPFEVRADQSVAGKDGDMGAYEASDFLWAKAVNAQPGSRVDLVFHHKMAGVKVVLEEESGFAEGEFARLPKTVTVDNTMRSAAINLSTGEATPVGNADRDIVMNPESGCWRAVVVPQTVASGKSTIGITIDGVSLSYTRDGGMVYEPGKLHTFTIKVAKTAPSGEYAVTLAAESITDWEADQSSHDFEANSYLVVNCSEPGRLPEAITAAGADASTVKNLKVTGVMDADDFTFVREGMPSLASINLKDVRIPEVYLGRDSDTEGDIYAENALPENAFSHNKTIRRFILPESIAAIGACAFSNTEPTSTIVIPESVTRICHDAFAYIWENAEIVLPGRLEYVGKYAFHTAAKFEMRLPSTLRYIGDHAFNEAGNAYGAFSIPSNLEYLGEEAFFKTGNALTGEIVIPAGLLETVDMDIRFASGTDITIPEGVRSINRLAGKFNSPVVLPKSLERIGQDAFYCTRFSSPMIFPENVAYIGPGAFLESNLPGRVEIPPLIDCVKARSFNCTQITDVIVGDNVLQIEDDAFGRNGALRHVELGKNLEYIGKGAFSESPELETIVCFAKEPPTASEAFSALEFDRTVLEVPAGCVGKYRNAPGWNQFSNITEHRELAFNIPLIECLDKGVVREGVLRAEGAWRVKECPDWVTVSPSSGEAKDQLTVRVASQAYGSEAREGEIVFQLDNNKDYTYSVGVRQLSHSEYGEDTEIVLQTASADGDAVPVMIVGEGFTASQITSGEYLARMNETMEQFFDIEPYHSLRDHFTVTTALACSPEEGVSDYTVTKANRFGTFGLEPDESRLRDYVTSVSQVLSGRMDDAMVIVVTNHNVFGGWTTICQDGFTIASIGNIPEEDAYPYDRRGLVQHYAGGAAFAGLGEEHVSHFEHIKSCKCGNCNALGTFNEMKSRGYYANLSLSGKMSEAPWKDFIFHPGYSSDVDMWEGGHRHLRGVWRSESQSVMGTYISYFNAISRFEIYKRVMIRAGLDWSLENFINNDNIEKPQQ